MNALPSFEVERRKLTHDLLDRDHPEGGSKARLFLAGGFRRSHPDDLAAALVDHAVASWPGDTVSGPFGTKVVIKGDMETPNGTVRFIRSVWQVEAGGDRLRLITAY